MLTGEEKFVIDLVRNVEKDLLIEKYKFYTLNYDKILDILIKNKILLSKYHYLRNISTKIDLIYRQLKFDNQNLYDSILSIIELFSKEGIQLILIKGIILDYDSFEYSKERMFTDIDLLVNNHNEVYKMIHILKRNNYVVKHSNLLFHDIKREIILNVVKNQFQINIEIKLGHKFVNSEIFFRNKRLIVIDDISFFAMSLESTFISQVLYLHYYFYNLESILLDNKLLLKYLVDFSSFLNKNINKIDFKIVKLFFLSYEEILERVIIDSAYYLQSQILEILLSKLNLNKKIFNRKDLSKISIFEKIFNSDFYKYYLINYNRPDRKDLSLCNVTKKIKKFKLNCNNDIVEIKFYRNNNYFYLKINNHSPYLYVLKLYYIDSYGEDVYPYDCYSFRIFPQPFIVNRFVMVDDVIIESKIKKLDDDKNYYCINKGLIEIDLESKIKHLFQNKEIYIDFDIYYVEDNNHIIKMDNLKNHGYILKFLIDYES